MDLGIAQVKQGIGSGKYRFLTDRSALYDTSTKNKLRKVSGRSGRKRSTHSVEVDFDLLVSNIENSIMADQGRAPVGITPQELLVRSNPAIYSFERELTRDLTNPREMYSLLSHSTKSTEDLTVKFKQEIAKNVQAPGVFPKLSRATTLNEIRRIQHGKSDKLGRFQGSSDIMNPNKKLNVLVLTHNRTSIEDFRTIVEEDKENLQALNLPNITQNAVSQDEVGVKNNDTYKNVQVELPTLPAEQNVGHKKATDAGENIVCNSGTSKLKSDNIKNSDPKLEKWFSEMPNEVFDKAQRAIMEASIKDKLTKYQHKRHRKENFPAHVNVLHGSRLRKVPNTFLEVRVDSFGKHLPTENRMDRYKLHQKSIHKLKMREMDEIERQEKMGREDIELTPRLSMQHRSHTTISQKNKTDASLEKPKHEFVSISDEKGLKTFDINEVLRRDILPRERTHINNYQDYAEKRHLTNSAPDSVFLRNCKNSNQETVPKPNSPVSKTSDVGGASNKTANETDRGVAKTSVVNIALNKDTPRQRNPLHIEQNIQTSQVRETTNAGNIDISMEVDEGNMVKDGEKDVQNEVGTEIKEDSAKCITKIPTARSSRTSDSNRSTISSKQSPKPNKSVLGRFNKLEVFAEHGKTQDAKMTRKSYHGHKLRDHESKELAMPPSYKLDLKNYPQHFKNPISDDMELMNTEVRKQELIFRFEPGEVFISRRPNPNRASERARIIYGKVLHKNDREMGGKAFDAKLAKESNSARSLSTRLDGYRFEIGNFESRALADSVPSESVREHEHPNTRISNILDDDEYVNRPDLDTTSTVTKTPLEWYNRYGKVVRDIAIETDVIGSETGTPMQYSVDEVGDKESKYVNRPVSNLSDFIVENNDGESLNSDSELEDIVPKSSIRQSRSTQKSRGTQSNLSNTI